MKQVTISLDEALYARAETLAAERGMTVDEMVRDLLTRAAGGGGEETEAARKARMRLVELAGASAHGMKGPWSREEAYAERLSRYERPDLRGARSDVGPAEVGEGEGGHGER